MIKLISMALCHMCSTLKVGIWPRVGIVMVLTADEHESGFHCKRLHTPSTCSHIRRASHSLKQTAIIVHSPSLPKTHTHTHRQTHLLTAGWPACRWPRLSHTLPSCLCGTWEPLWSRASHTLVLMTLRPAAQRKCAPSNKDWVTSTPSPSSRHTHTPRNSELSTGIPGTPSGLAVLYCQPVKHGTRSPWELEWLK